MKLQTVSRKANSKSEVNRLRREGFIPAVLYLRGKEGETLAIKSSEFGAYLRHVKSGHLPTTVFTLAKKSLSFFSFFCNKKKRNILNFFHIDSYSKISNFT